VRFAKGQVTATSFATAVASALGAVSVFDLFKIGIGPSSLHTGGAMRALHLFVLRLEPDDLLGVASGVRRCSP
jgi:hypothetical protein